MPKPKTDNPREKQVAFFMTREDADSLDEMARACGFSARSTLITAIMEALMSRSFSLPGFIKLHSQIMERLEKHKYPFRYDVLGFMRPNPHFPDSDLTEEEIQQVIEEITARKKQSKKGK